MNQINREKKEFFKLLCSLVLPWVLIISLGLFGRWTVRPQVALIAAFLGVLSFLFGIIWYLSSRGRANERGGADKLPQVELGMTGLVSFILLCAYLSLLLPGLLFIPFDEVNLYIWAPVVFTCIVMGFVVERLATRGKKGDNESVED